MENFYGYEESFGSLVGVVMMVGSCVATDIIAQIEKDSSQSGSRKESVDNKNDELIEKQWNIAARLPMLEKRYSERCEKPHAMVR